MLSTRHLPDGQKDEERFRSKLNHGAELIHLRSRNTQFIIFVGVSSWNDSLNNLKYCSPIKVCYFSGMIFSVGTFLIRIPVQFIYVSLLWIGFQFQVILFFSVRFYHSLEVCAANGSEGNKNITLLRRCSIAYCLNPAIKEAGANIRMILPLSSIQFHCYPCVLLDFYLVVLSGVREAGIIVQIPS